MRIDLTVPFAEKDKAKRLGARWDVERKTWYVENLEDLAPFLRWMPKHLTKPHLGSGTTRRLDETNSKHLRSILEGE